MPIEVRALTPADAAYVRQALTAAFHGPLVAVHDELIDASALPGAIAQDGGEPVGLLTYRAVGGEWEVVTIAADRPGSGAGGALLDWVRVAATAAGGVRLWLVTTNDNVRALRFYQRRGYDLVAVHREAVTRARALKPGIPEVVDGIPVRHEVELELRL
ncbi:GNAT family N-acetyltransferase [Amorphoplanes nipponensis]|uniref:N-acetyltransferase n=1 Tax=Actinoplanes nipponensis TaxID=135950 RepID=A0A919JPM3_9ACTN|nr:GNAT family N-acetyltransferase [Actinoplanes nipponensis]GIE53025.1 N-acetyltransferase [Actinoplanes nipponensis]